MIQQPRNVELTKIHHYDRSKNESNLTISTISKEVCDDNFNKNAIIKRNVFGHRWVLRVNDRRPRGVKKRKRVRVVVYIVVFCSIAVAVCFGIFFSIYKNRYEWARNKIIGVQNITNVTDLNNINLNKTDENQEILNILESATIKTEQITTIENIHISSTPISVCGDCLIGEEVCFVSKGTETPECVKIVDKNDPTGCGGLCPINTHFCQILDVKSKVYQCSPIKRALVCSNNNFNCGNMCIPQDRRCDGLIQCSNGSDEENCDCDLETHFHCGNLTSCLEKKKKCDRKVDCWDRSDEMNCDRAMFCKQDEIACDNTRCVSKEKICDGIFDCSDRTDEPEGCLI